MTEDINAAKAALRKVNRERKNRERQNKRDLGLVSVTVWIWPELKHILKAVEKKLSKPKEGKYE